MRQYFSDSTPPHGSPDAVGVLVANLGSPDEPTPPALTRYLREFLTDPRVIETSRWIWRPILEGIVLRRRPSKVAPKYQGIWTEDGSPLIAISRRQTEGIEARLKKRVGEPLHCAMGMRYGNPSIEKALEELRDKGCRRILVFPLYPQYAAATVASIFDAAADVLKTWRWIPEVRFINHYHDDSGYIRSLAQSIRDTWATDGPPDRLLFSFHGIPRSAFLKGDPYHCECHKTARLVTEALELSPERWMTCFQSRFGKEEWLEPYTDRMVEALAKGGVKRLDILCPGFSADCLETLEEIGEENREIFEEHGGEHLRYIPALNDRDDHMEALADLAYRHLGGWVTPSDQYDAEVADRERAESRRRAEALMGRNLNTTLDPASETLYGPGFRPTL